MSLSLLCVQQGSELPHFRRRVNWINIMLSCVAFEPWHSSSRLLCGAEETWNWKHNKNDAHILSQFISLFQLKYLPLTHNSYVYFAAFVLFYKIYWSEISCWRTLLWRWAFLIMKYAVIWVFWRYGVVKSLSILLYSAVHVCAYVAGCGARVRKKKTLCKF